MNLITSKMALRSGGSIASSFPDSTNMLPSHGAPRFSSLLILNRCYFISVPLDLRLRARESSPSPAHPPVPSRPRRHDCALPVRHPRPRASVLVFSSSMAGAGGLLREFALSSALRQQCLTMLRKAQFTCFLKFQHVQFQNLLHCKQGSQARAVKRLG